jgi:hypothetical protein
MAITNCSSHLSSPDLNIYTGDADANSFRVTGRRFRQEETLHCIFQNELAGQLGGQVQGKGLAYENPRRQEGIRHAWDLSAGQVTKACAVVLQCPCQIDSRPPPQTTNSWMLQSLMKCCICVYLSIRTQYWLRQCWFWVFWIHGGLNPWLKNQ